MPAANHIKCSHLGKPPGNLRVMVEGNFTLCYLQGDILAPELREKLLEKRIMVRNCATFDGLDDHYFRMSLKSKQENSHCLKVLKSILS